MSNVPSAVNLTGVASACTTNLVTLHPASLPRSSSQDERYPIASTCGGYDSISLPAFTTAKALPCHAVTPAVMLPSAIPLIVKNTASSASSQNQEIYNTQPFVSHVENLSTMRQVGDRTMMMSTIYHSTNAAPMIQQPSQPMFHQLSNPVTHQQILPPNNSYAPSTIYQHQPMLSLAAANGPNAIPKSSNRVQLHSVSVDVPIKSSYYQSRESPSVTSMDCSDQHQSLTQLVNVSSREVKPQTQMLFNNNSSLISEMNPTTCVPSMHANSSVISHNDASKVHQNCSKPIDQNAILRETPLATHNQSISSSQNFRQFQPILPFPKAIESITDIDSIAPSNTPAATTSSSSVKSKCRRIFPSYRDRSTNKELDYCVNKTSSLTGPATSDTAAQTNPMNEKEYITVQEIGESKVLQDTRNSEERNAANNNVSEAQYPKYIFGLLNSGKGNGDAYEVPMTNSEQKLVDGKKCFCCPVCNDKFTRLYQYKRHQVTHTDEKRGSLTMKNKIDIIHRAKAGEKQIDLAVEYNVGRSTLTTIMKDSQKYLDVEREGQFSGDRRRLRRAKREDVEEALYMWYRQVVAMNVNITGPKLCEKGKDFAVLLGYKDFKATHGWLDRFKHRKNISLGRSKTIKEPSCGMVEDSDHPLEFNNAVLPELIANYDPKDVYFADEFGLLFSLLPDECAKYSGKRCTGGSHSADRLTLLVCCNMSSTEKFPLVVVGRYKKPEPCHAISELPVTYYFNGKSWMTSDIYTAWIKDIDNWFTRYNRKVLLIIPSSPVHHCKASLNAIKVVVAPRSFLGPVKLGISKAVKELYRRSVLECVEKAFNDKLKMNIRFNRKSFRVSLAQSLELLSKAWNNLTMKTITNSFLKAGICKYGMWSINSVTTDNELSTDNLDLLYCLRKSGFSLLENFTFSDYVTVDDHIQVCHLMNDKDIISSITKADAECSDSETELEDLTENKIFGKKNTLSTGLSSVPQTTAPLLSDSITSALDNLRHYVQMKSAVSPELVDKFHRLEGLLSTALHPPSQLVAAPITH